MKYVGLNPWRKRFGDHAHMRRGSAWLNMTNAFIWLQGSQFTRAVSRDNKQLKVRRYSNLPWVGVHPFHWNVLELILVQYSPHLKKVLETVAFSSARRQAARLIRTFFTIKGLPLKRADECLATVVRWNKVPILCLLRYSYRPIYFPAVTFIAFLHLHTFPIFCVSDNVFPFCSVLMVLGIEWSPLLHPSDCTTPASLEDGYVVIIWSLYPQTIKRNNRYA
jgi:hypothetical protein